MNYFRTIALGLFALGCQVTKADFIAADFRTTKGDFTVSLDYLNAPLAVANFIQLAGKGDDILETAPGVQDVNAFGHDRQLYSPTASSDVQRLPLTVALVPETPDFRAYYGIYQSQTLIGGVETTFSGGYFKDITGEDRIRLEPVSFDPRQYRITLRYPRPWLDARDLRIKEAPMYRVLKVHRVEQGRRFFAGTMTDDRFEHPGYHFQDEMARNLGNVNNPYGIPFNSPGVLAMDSLGPNRNGSGFFITSVAEPTFNGRYTAFGNVIDFPNLAVVQSIANTNLNSDGDPAEDIYIIDITIRRGGPTANAFMESFQQKYLPGSTAPVPLSITRDADGFSLVTALRPQTQNATYFSTDLMEYSGGFIEGMGPNATAGLQIDLAPVLNFAPKAFFKSFGTSLPKWPSSELNLENARLFFKVTPAVDEGGTMNLYFGEIFENPDGQDDGLIRVNGSYNINMTVVRTGVDVEREVVSSVGTGTFSATYDSSESPYEGRLVFSNVTGPLNVGRITLHFDSGVGFNNPQINPALFIRRFDAATTDPEVPFLNYSGVFQKLQ